MNTKKWDISCSVSHCSISIYLHQRQRYRPIQTQPNRLALCIETIHVEEENDSMMGFMFFYEVVPIAATLSFHVAAAAPTTNTRSKTHRTAHGSVENNRLPWLQVLREDVRGRRSEFIKKSREQRGLLRRKKRSLDFIENLPELSVSVIPLDH